MLCVFIFSFTEESIFSDIVLISGRGYVVYYFFSWNIFYINYLLSPVFIKNMPGMPDK